MNSKIYIIWLKLACILTGFTGLISVAASTEKGSYLWLTLFDLLKWPLDGDPSNFLNESFSLNAVLGGVMIGWATLMYLLINEYLRKYNIRILNYILISLIVWFISDSIGSFLCGLHLNIVLNSIFLILFSVPILIIKKTNK